MSTICQSIKDAVQDIPPKEWNKKVYVYPHTGHIAVRDNGGRFVKGQKWEVDVRPIICAPMGKYTQKTPRARLLSLLNDCIKDGL